MKLADIIKPGIQSACAKIFSLVSSAAIKVQPNEIEIYGTKIQFAGNPVPSVTLEGQAVVLRWADGATIDVSRLPGRLDPSVRHVEIFADHAEVFTGYGSITLRS